MDYKAGDKLSNKRIDRHFEVVEKNGVLFLKDLKFKHKNKHMLYLTQRVIEEFGLEKQ